MREIKFRAWNKLTNKMYSHKDLEDVLVNLTKNDFISGIFLPLNSDNELMQYIGIEDEGEKEIYEGDIVKRIDRTPIAQMYGKEVIGVVVFTEGSFSLNTHEGYYLMNNNRLSNLCSYKVIGNIYENPELLNKI